MIDLILNNIFNIINGLSSETNKLDDEELACLFNYLTKSTDLAKVEKCLVACPNNNTKLLYLRMLSKESSPDKKKKDTKRSRTFASSNRIYKDINYYIEPTTMIKNLGGFLLDGKFTLFYGHRQSGKSTTAHAVKEWLEDEYDKEVYVVTLSRGIVVDEGLDKFWSSLCDKVQSLNADRFRYDVFAQASASSNTFESLFSRHNNPSAKDCIIIVDEASYLAGKQKLLRASSAHCEF